MFREQLRVFSISVPYKFFSFYLNNYRNKEVARGLLCQSLRSYCLTMADSASTFSEDADFYNNLSSLKNYYTTCVNTISDMENRSELLATSSLVIPDKLNMKLKDILKLLKKKKRF